ncbi:YceD family protein [Propionivibrio sp.]|uniref:YceD family protein n=1 Tax=Propionivibrio sp. TaxID=2212460 RepID=UPI003BF05A43
MSQRIVINSLAFAREERSLQGELPVASLARVLDKLVDSAGSLSYRVVGRISPRNRPQLLLQLDGLLSVCCQRCLEGIDYPLAVRSVLEFVDDEEDLTQEEIEDDSKDFLPVQSELDVVALIEDEIILYLPSAPRHESCALPDTGQGTGKISPFSVLNGFRGKA